MPLLAIDTSGPSCAVCLARAAGSGDGVAVLARRAERIGRGHAERLVAMVEEALAEAQLRFDDVDGVAVATGPGSFTGVRVGVAAARGLALALEIPAVGVASLEALAAEAAAATAAPLVIVALAGPRGKVFALVHGPAGAVLLGPTLITPGDVAQIAGERHQPVALIGAGAPAVAAALAAYEVDASLVREAEAPDEAWVARLALAGAGVSPPRPLYLRPPDAKPQAGYAVARA